MYLAYALTEAYSPNFSSPIPFTSTVCQNLPKFSPPNISCVRYMQTRKYCLYIVVLYNTTLVLQCVASVFLPLNKHYIKFLFIQSSQSYVSFILESSEACKDIWKTCIEHHTFFKLHKPPEPQKKTFFKRGSKFTYR